MPSGTIIITDDHNGKPDVIACIYARVSSAENKDNLDRQAEWLKSYAIARGYKIYKIVREIGSGLNDNRKQLAKILVDPNYNVLIIEHKDRLARFGTNYLHRASRYLVNLLVELEITTLVVGKNPGWKHSC